MSTDVHCGTNHFTTLQRVQVIWSDFLYRSYKFLHM